MNPEKTRLQCLRESYRSVRVDGCPTFASAYSGFPVELAGVGALHAAFLNEGRTRGCWWRPVQEIRIRGPKMMGAAQRSLSPNWPQRLIAHLNVPRDFAEFTCRFAP